MVWRRSGLPVQKSREFYEMYLELPADHVSSPAAFESLTCGVFLKQNVIQ